MRGTRLFRTALLAAALFPAAGAAEGPDARFVEETRGYFARLEKLGFSGEVLVARDGIPLLAEGYGLADRENGTRWSPATVTTLGSITKQFTAAAILALEGDGLLSVSDPIAKYFPDVPEDKRGITLQQLLTHSSGVTDPDDIGDFDPIGREEYVRRILGEKLAFAPGTSYQYANAGYSLLGAIVEKVSGKSYERFLRDRLLAPNGLYETGYKLPQWGPGRLAVGYGPAERWGTVLGRPMAEDGPYWALRANGGIHSTAFDVLRWAEALRLGHALPAAAVERMWTRYVSEGGDSSYGYGWSILTLAGGTKVVTHNGGNGIYFADLAIVPSAKAVLFIATNAVSRSPLGLLNLIGQRFLSGRPYPEIPDVVPRPAAELDAVVGRYAKGGDAVEVSRRGDELALSARGAAAFARLHSARKPDVARCERLSRRMDRIVPSLLERDFGPLHEAYGNAVPLERLKTIWNERLDRLVREHGAVRGHEILGTASEEERDVTLVRVRFERGTVERAFVWSPGTPEKLLGISVRGIAAIVRCVPVAGGGFATWNLASGASVPVRFDKDGTGRLRILLGTGAEAFGAFRVE
jgi:CubicO group peptidase (beta-lactamase class C family)